MQVKLINNIEDFKGIKEQWNEVIKNMQNPQIFYTWEWTHAYLRFLCREDMDLFIIVFTEGDLYIGIVPLCIECIKLGPFRFKVLHHILYKEVCYGDFYFHKDYNQRKLLKKTFEIIFKEQKRWDYIKLLNFNSRGSVTFLIEDVVKNDFHYPCFSEQHQVTSYLELSKLKTKMNTKDIKEIQRREKKLFQECKIDIYIHESWNSEIWDKFLEFHRKKWEDSVFNKKSFVDFYECVMKDFQEKGQLEFSYLLVDQKIGSINIGFIDDEKICGYFTVCDYELGQSGVGLILLKHLISYYENKKVYFDFLGGNQRYKFYWADCAHMNYNFYIINKNKKSNFLKFYIQKAEFLRKIYKKCRRYLHGITSYLAR